MLHPVANNKPADTHLYVVSAYLVEYPLVDGNMGRFVFYNHNGTRLSIIDNRIATLLCVVEIQGNLVGDAGCVVPLLVDKKMNEVLTNPLFRRKNDVFFA